MRCLITHQHFRDSVGIVVEILCL